MEASRKQNTIYDISQKAGVSIATVSRVLNDSPKVSPKTKERVRAVMDDLDYQPNVFARGLGTGSMKTIGILCADVADIYLANAVSFLERELRKQGFNTILNCTGYNYNAKKKSLKAIESRRVDAVIMVGSHYIEKTTAKNAYIMEAARRIPIMMVNGYLRHKNICGMTSDDKEAFRNATEALIEKGCKRIAFLYREVTYSQGLKYEGYVQALEENGIKVDDSLYIQSSEKIQNIGQELKKLFNSKRKSTNVDAIIACDDELAVGALKFLSKENIKVPEEVSVIGCNNSVLSISCEPELTSIDNMCEAICIDVVNNLMRVLNGEKAAQKVMVGCSLVERDTTK